MSFHMKKSRSKKRKLFCSNGVIGHLALPHVEPGLFKGERSFSQMDLYRSVGKGPTRGPKSPRDGEP